VTATGVFAFEGLSHDSGCEKWCGIGVRKLRLSEGRRELVLCMPSGSRFDEVNLFLKTMTYHFAQRLCKSIKTEERVFVVFV